MGDILKGFYYACEDKWYAGLDFLDKHGIPVYKVIDPIDQRIPSFALFSILVLLGLIFIVLPFGMFFQGAAVNVVFEVVDEESSPLPNIPVSFTYLDVKDKVLTTNPLGRIELSVPSGTTIKYAVDTEKYEIIKKSVTAAANTIEVIQLSELQTGSLSKTLKLVNEVGQPILASAELVFTCATTYGIPPNPVGGTGGVFTITPNADCIPLSVTIHAQGYQDVQSYPIVADKDVYNIVMYGTQVKDASIIVTVLDNQNNPVPGLDVSIQTEGIIVENNLTDAGGIVTFSVSAGDYTVVVSDPIQQLYTSQTESLFVGSGETGTLTFHVSKNAANTISTTVIDKKTSAPIVGATVKLKQGNTILQTVVTGADGKANLPISDKTQSYMVSAFKEGYVPSQQTVSGAATTVTFALEKATGTNTAKLTVHLHDQDNDPVADAKVVLYNADTGFLAPYEAVLSDMNGNAKFNAVASGNYKAFAYKATLTGFSEEQFFDITDPTTYDFSIALEVPDGTVSVHVTDKDGQPVPFAKVSVYNAFKNKLLGADLTDSNGTYILPSNDQKSKADKDVYLVVTKAGYATVHTVQKPVIPETVQHFEVILPPTNPSGNINIELVGLFAVDGKIVTGVGKGKDYIARFRIDIPEEHDDVEELNIHVRTGEKDIVEKDEWYIKSVNFPNSSVVKGSSWDPANGINIDGESITFGNAKWINAHRIGPNPGIHELEATVHVRETALPQDILKIFYKAQTENAEILRDPIDANPVDELYAATKSAQYQVGVTTTCDKDFCFDASILSLDDQIITDVTDQYNAKIFNDYKLTFNILNNGNGFHTNSNLRIKASSDLLEFTTYEIYNAEAQLLQGTVNDFEFKAPIVLGDFTPQKKVGGTINFKPHAAGTAIISLELVSDFQTVFSKTIQVNITGNKNMIVTVIPDTFPSGIPIEIMVHAEDEGTGDEIKDALVSLETNLGIVLASTLTDAAGNATIILPAQLPGKKITLKVQKADYNPYEQILSVSDKILSFNPEILGVNINVKTESEKTKSFTITNETSLPIIITKMSIQGNLKGFLDKEKIDSALLPYIGITIAPKGTLEVNLKSVLTQEGLALQEHEDIEAIIAIEVENYGTPWVFDYPVKYSLAVSSEVDDPTCLIAVPNVWNTSTDGQKVTFQFQIQNNCSIAGLPASLKNLAVKANWNGNVLGDTVLTVYEQVNPQLAIGGSKVYSGFFSPVLTNMPAQSILIARLDFTPFGGIKGEGKFDIEIQATNPLEGQSQLLSTKIASTITIVNLADCISFDKEIIDIIPGGKDSVTIETKGCGAPVDFILQSDVMLSAKEFKMQGTDKKTIEVLDDALDQGQYAIYVNTEGNEEKVPSQKKVLRVRIKDPNACLQLNRYEFEVYDDPTNDLDGFDTARIDNLCTQQKVKVKVKIDKEFMDSLERGLIAGVVAGVLQLVNNAFDDEVALWGGPETAPAATGATAGAVGGAAAGGVTTGQTAGTPIAAGAPYNGFKYDAQGNEYLVKNNIPVAKIAKDGTETPILYDSEGYYTEQATSTVTVGDCVVDFLTKTCKTYLPIEEQNAISNLQNNPPAPTPAAPPVSVSSVESGKIVQVSPIVKPSVAMGLIVATNGTALFQAQAANPAGQSGGQGGVVQRPASQGIPAPGTQPAATENAYTSNVLGGILSKLTGLVSLGTNNPLVTFAVTTIVYTIIDYLLAEDEKFDITLTAPDVQIDSFMMIAGEKGSDESNEDNDIEVEESGIALNPKINLDQPSAGKVESSNLTFTNISGFKNQSIFRNLLVSGTRTTFDDDQEIDDEKPSVKDLDSQEDDVKVRFHLQFNSFTPESLIDPGFTQDVLSCDTYSEKTGKTGINAAPKVAFAWNFTDIDAFACDEGTVDNAGNASHIYCDATQFSIALLQKTELLRQFIEANAPFTCPAEDLLSSEKTQPIPAADIGIASIATDKVNGDDINILVGIQNNTPVPNKVKLTVQYKLDQPQAATVTLTKDVQMGVGGSKVTVGFVVANLADGKYLLNADIVPETCEDCSNSAPASDVIATTFFVGVNSELLECEPFSTTRLDEFIQATEESGQGVNYPAGLSKDEVMKLVNFRAHLMQDRFSPDFFNDFDRYANKVSFFDAPTYYLNNEDGLRKFFINKEHWIVNREGNPLPPEGYLLPGPGIYDVSIDINFTDIGMDFFKNGEPDAKISIFMEKTSTVEDNSPFYSLPFNGLIGTDDGQGRVGYGVNYSGEKVAVNADASQQVSTIDIADSTPVATVQTTKTDAYTILNSLERGDVLTVTRNASNALTIKWSPSYATPVMMKITSKSALSDAYGFYSVGVNNDTSQSYIGAQGNPWYGVGANCRDFEDKAMYDAYNPRYDVSAINADCALVGPQENISYGFEWCGETINTGNVHMQSIFYTPQGSLSTISQVAAKEDVVFIGEGVNGNNIPLNGSDVLPGNSVGDELGSMEEILNLVKEEAICVRNTGAKTEFFWNPKEVLNALTAQEKAASAACIIK